MAPNIERREAERLPRKLSAATGESLTTAVENALRERLERQRGRDRAATIARRLQALGDELRELPVLDSRSPEARATLTGAVSRRVSAARPGRPARARR